MAPFFLYYESAILIGEGKLHPRIGIDVIIFGLKVLFALCSLCKKREKGIRGKTRVLFSCTDGTPGYNNTCEV